MHRRLLFVAALLALLPGVALAGAVSGKVFIDANADGAWQQGEMPLEGALVSDGIAIVSTAADGAYSLQTPDGPQVIFVVNPPGTWPTAGFYRNVSEYPATADFPLEQQEQELPFYFVQGTDLHIRPDVTEQMARYVQAVNDLPMEVAFVVHTGDLVRDAIALSVEDSRALFEVYRGMVAGIEAPLLHLPGNHEHAAVGHAATPPETPGWGKALYREMFGPMYYAFRYANAQFIAMDGSTIGEGRILGSIPDECMVWFEAYLQYVDPADPIVMLVHQPFQGAARKARLEELLQGYNFALALSGHGHGAVTWDFAGGKEIMGGATSYAWHGSGFPPDAMGYHVVRITQDGFESAFADWAEPWSLSLRKPARSRPIDAGALDIEAVIFDPRNQIASVDVALAEGSAQVTELGVSGLYRTVAASLNTGTPPEGIYELSFTMHGGEQTFVERQSLLLVGGPEQPFAAEGPVTLLMRGMKINAPNQVLVNGTPVGEMDPQLAERTRFEFAVPAECLRRLNRVEVLSARDAEGNWDSFVLDIIEFSYQGRAYVDALRYRYSGRAISPNGDEPGRFTTYLDLTQPMQ